MQWFRTSTINPPEGGTVHLWQADAADWETRRSDLESVLGAEEVERADRFLHPVDRDRYVVAHGVLRRVLGSCLGLDPAALVFGRGPHEKPFIRSPDGDSIVWQFNLSHSGNRILIAVARGTPVGVDVERVSRPVEIESLSRRFFSRLEADHILALPESGRQAAFIDTWVCKEAFIKAVGEGLSMPLDSFSVVFGPDGTRLTEGDTGDNLRLARPWSIRHFPVAPDYAGAVALPLQSILLRGFHLI